MDEEKSEPVTESPPALSEGGGASTESVEPPFSSVTHLCTVTPDENAQHEIAAFRDMLREKHDLYDEDWATDEQLHRCLVAKQFNKEVALNLATEALKWRKKRAPHLIESTEGWQRAFELESETGKIYSPGLDRWGRPIVVFDNGAANTTNIDAQMLFLGWTLNFACREMPKNIDKYHIFMHLESFSFFSIPPLSATTETIHMLCNTFPERLGHCIAYRPPGLFKTFFSSVKPFIDPKTAAKMVFITGDVSDGSANDKLLRELIGDDWKVLTGAEQPILQKTKPASSPGYLHSQQWPALMKRVEVVQEREKEEEAKRPKKEPSAASVKTNTSSPTSPGEKGSEPHTPLEALPALYEDDDDRKRTTYSSHAEFKRAKVPHEADCATPTAISIPRQSHYLAISAQEDGPIITVLLLLLEQLFYFLEELFSFKKYVSHVVDSFLGPSTPPTKVFIRIALMAFTFFHAGENPRMRTFAFSYLVIFLTLYFLFHDLKSCKTAVKRFAEENAL